MKTCSTANNNQFFIFIKTFKKYFNKNKHILHPLFLCWTCCTNRLMIAKNKFLFFALWTLVPKSFDNAYSTIPVILFKI